MSNFITLDIGASKIAAQIYSNGIIYKNFLFETPEASIAEKKLKKIISVLAKANHKKEPIKFVGIASAPSVNTKGVVIGWPNHPGWKGLNIYDFFYEQFKVPVKFWDDGYAAAVADGIALKASNILHISVGTGVGGALIAKKIPGPGYEILAEELGHITVEENGLPCVCGKYGCLQAYASGRSILKSVLADNAIGLSFYKNKELLKNEPEKLSSALSNAALALKRLIHNFNQNYDFEVVTLGGGVIEVFPEIIDMVNALCEKNNYIKIMLSPNIGRGALIGAKNLLDINQKISSKSQN